MVTVLKEKGIFAGVNLFSKQDTMDITDMFKIPLFKNFTLKMREEFLDNFGKLLLVPYIKDFGRITQF